MTGISQYWKNLAISVVITGGMAAVPVLAQSSDASQASVRSAQQHLKNSGYYHGAVDGVDGPATRTAIRKYQSENKLEVNGRLDQQTCDKLGVTNTGEASRSDENSTETGNPSAATNSSAVSAAQRSLQKKGFYKGNIDGTMGQETQAAIREFQKNSNLNVTGKLDQATMSRLGVAK